MIGNDHDRIAEARADEQARLTRLVDGHAIDAQDRAMLMAMLGLDDRAPALRTPHVGPLN
ncbi:hypothetical protein [Kibdelosporangium aridum]|uniref:Uncharacterized protein n=1 Tax=Kibdelosporangium aridum TaxID=2030 RepID=A0A1Y5X2Q9_KIBAR|nr:hypothetical protein [Kibdelosporangium aridum]SMC65200.1 hypothetical protein SAMN05661093_01165 [Kibdelosporangium aridum]